MGYSRFGRDRLLLRVFSEMGRPRGFLTGGYVRDLLLGRASGDLDFALVGDAEAARQPAQRLAAALATRPHLIGRAPRWVWRIENRDLKVELWPLGDLSVAADLRRRDFTVNALAWMLPEGPLVDEVGGLGDLGRQQLRAIARANLRDDPIRLLRAGRFVAQLVGFSLEAETAAWIRELAPSLAGAPKERAGSELLALLRGPRAALGLQTLVNLGLSDPVAPTGAVSDLDWFAGHHAAADLLTTQGRHPVNGARREGGDAARLALLLRLWQISDPAAVAGFGWPRQIRLHAARAAALLKPALASATAAAPARRQLIHEAGPAFPALLAAAAALDVADGSEPGPWQRWWRQWRRSGPALVKPRPLLAAAVVAEVAGVSPGPELGRLMAGLIRAQVCGTVRTPGGARRWLRRKAVGG